MYEWVNNILETNNGGAILIVFCLPILREIDAWLGTCRTEDSHSPITRWPALMAQATLHPALKVPPLARCSEKLPI